MKQKLKIFLSIFALGFLVFGTSFAQNNPPATSTSDAGISISEDVPLNEKYDIDFTGFNWTEQIAQQAADYLKVQSELIDVKVDFPASKLVLTLDIDHPSAATWGVEEWNTLLAEIK